MIFKMKPIYVSAERYTDPASVERIMDMIGSKGVLNTERSRLLIARPEQDFDGYASKGSWVLLADDGSISVIPDDMFTEAFEEVCDEPVPTIN